MFWQLSFCPHFKRLELLGWLIEPRDQKNLVTPALLKLSTLEILKLDPSSPTIDHVSLSIDSALSLQIPRPAAKSILSSSMKSILEYCSNAGAVFLSFFKRARIDVQ